MNVTFEVDEVNSEHKIQETVAEDVCSIAQEKDQTVPIKYFVLDLNRDTKNDNQITTHQPIHA